MSNDGTNSSSYQGLFAPFRALGYITNDVPICIQQRGQTFAITTCIGRSFQIYDGEKLGLLFVGSQADDDISAMQVYKDYTFAAVGSHVLVHLRGKQIARFISDDARGPIHQLMIFGNTLLALYSDCIRMWDHTTHELDNVLGFDERFSPSFFLHPATYLNKILVGGQNGVLQLWNIRTLSLIYEFPSFGSPITFLVQAPTVDVIAIGLLDGRIIIYDIRSAEEIMRFKQEGKVTAISFRTGMFMIQ
jgi:U3 small nucleolar RNA-associated protein 21